MSQTGMGRGKTALITGASGGIGAATARRLAADGCAVALHYHKNRDAAESLCRELAAAGARAIAVQADLRDEMQVGKMVDNVFAEFCQLDNLICNAGASWTGLFGEMTATQWRDLMAVNLDGVFFCCKSVLPHFISRKSGCIVTISSIWGQSGASCEVAYSAAKAGIIGLTRALAKELGPSGVTVNCVAPGVIDTQMNASLAPQELQALSDNTPLGRIGTPDDVAGAVSFLCRDDARFITGQVIGVNGGLFP